MSAFSAANDLPPTNPNRSPQDVPHADGLACKAIKLADGWECQTCALGWDDGDAKPACQKLTYRRLYEALHDEAMRIEQSQRALTAGVDPVNRFRNQDRIRRALELRAAGALIAKGKEGKS